MYVLEISMKGILGELSLEGQMYSHDQLKYVIDTILLFSAVRWHPVHEHLFASGGSDGAIMFWLVG